MLNQLVRAGIIDPHWIRDLDIYEEFQAMEIKCVMCKYTILAEKYSVGEESVRKIIKMMRDE